MKTKIDRVIAAAIFEDGAVIRDVSGIPNVLRSPPEYSLTT